jgi:hypothetical protein
MRPLRTRVVDLIERLEAAICILEAHGEDRNAESAREFAHIGADAMGNGDRACLAFIAMYGSWCDQIIVRAAAINGEAVTWH